MTVSAALRERVDRAFAGASRDEQVGAGEGLFALAGLADREPRVRAALTDPAVSPDAKRSLLADLVGGQVSPLAVSVAGEVVGVRLREPELAETLDELAAGALFAAAEHSGDLERVEDELFRFSRLYAGARGLRAALTDPVLPDARKEAIITDLLSGKADEVTVLLVRQLIARGRAHVLDRALTDLAAMAAARRNRVVAEVRTAIELTGERRQRLEDALRDRVGRPVELHVIIDPDVVGSLAVRVGDELYDGTVKRQLDAARELLAG